MGENSNNAKRALNFSSTEESLLISLVDKYAAIIENKKTDANSNKTKNAAWINLGKEFNSLSGENFRNAQVLRNKYLNLKKKSKSKFAEEKKYLYGTGGGPPKIYEDPTYIDTKIKEIIGSRMTGFESQFDNDENEDALEEEQLLVVIQNESEEFPLEKPPFELPHVDELQGSKICQLPDETVPKEIIRMKNWTEMSQEMRTPVSSKMKVNEGTVKKRDNTLKTKLADWAKSKNDVVLIQQQCLEEESKQKMRHNQEKHLADMKNKKELHEQLLEMNRQQHELKMSILQLEKQKLMQDMSNKS